MCHFCILFVSQSELYKGVSVSRTGQHRAPEKVQVCARGSEHKRRHLLRGCPKTTSYDIRKWSYKGPFLSLCPYSRDKICDLSTCFKSNIVSSALVIKDVTIGVFQRDDTTRAFLLLK